MHLHTGCSHWVRCAPWSERRFGSTHCASQGFDAPGLRGGGRCRWRGGAGRFCTAQFALHPTHIVFPSLHGAHCMRPQVEAQRCSPRDRRRRAPRKGIQRVLLCSCGRRPGCRPPPPRMIAVSPPPLLEFPPPAPPSIYLCAIYIPVFPLRYQRDLSRLSALLADYTGTVQKSKKALEKHSLQLARSS